MDPTGGLIPIALLFDQALVDADAWYQGQGLDQVDPYPTTPGGYPQPELQYSIPADGRVDHEPEQSALFFGFPMLEPQTAVDVPTQANSVNKDAIPVGCSNDGDSPPPVPVVCKKPDLHGILIKHWPHQCTGDWATRTTGKTVWVQSITCGVKDCLMTFKKARAFDRHYRTVHIRAANQSKLDCTIEGCHRVGEEGFTRKDNLTQHMRSVHGEDIPKNPVRFNGSVDYLVCKYGTPAYLVKGATGKGHDNING